jgi:hypothetical protein
VKDGIISAYLNLHEYINHAVQTEERRKEISDLIDYGVNDSKIAKYFFGKRKSGISKEMSF